MNIIVGASSNNQIGSRLIRWWMGTEYSHVYARWHLNTQDRDILYEASHGAVHFRKYQNFLKENKVVVEFSIPVTDEQFLRFSQKCIDLAQEPYSKLELLQIFISDLLKSKKETKDRHGYICSELLSILLLDLGFQFNKPTYLIRPDDIINVLTTRAIKI
jgi:hypothetical protein